MLKSVVFTLLFAVPDVVGLMPTASAECATSTPAPQWTHHVGVSAEFDLPPGWAVAHDGPDGFSAVDTVSKRGRGSVDFGVRQPRRFYRYSDFRGDVERVISSDRRQGRVQSVRAIERDGTSFVMVTLKSVAPFGSRVVDTYIKVPQEDLATGGYIYVLALESLDGVVSGPARASLTKIYERILKSLRVRVPYSGPKWSDNPSPAP
jgi:hypothetical protein